MKLATKLLLAMSGLVVVTAALVGLLIYRSIGDTVAPAATIGNSVIVAALIAVVLAVLLAAGVSRSLLRPIRRMTLAVQDSLSNKPVDLPVASPGEVGVLARAFQHYIERERMFAAALESSDDAVMTTALDGTVTGWNPAAERLYGYSATEVVGRNAELIVPEDRRHIMVEGLQTIGKGAGYGERDTVHLAKDGRRLELEAKVSAVRDASGKVIGSLAILSDQTEKRRAEANFRLAFEGAPNGMIMVDQSGIITLVNPQIERMFGYDRDELTGQPIHMLVPERFRDEHPANVGAFAADPSARAMGAGRDLHGRCKDGREFPVEIGLQPLETAAGLLVLGAVVDISERRMAERALEARTKELERSNAELEQFAYVASHDLREPLRMVASYTEILAERYHGELDERAQKYIGYIVDGAKRMQMLVTDLLALSRVGTQGKPLVPVSADDVLSFVLRSMTARIEHGGAQVTAGSLPVVAADEGQLGQLFQNLIDNALKFRAPDRAPAIDIAAERANGAWTFSVRDNGIGIDDQYAERIFQMFQRLHGRDEYDGSGIGLAIAKKIVERHGGRIWFESAVGEGTVFYFTLLQGHSGVS